MMVTVETLTDRLDQAADDVLQGFERTVDLGFGDRAVFGIDDDRSHGEASESGRGLPRTPIRAANAAVALSSGRVHPLPAALFLSVACGRAQAPAAGWCGQD